MAESYSCFVSKGEQTFAELPSSESQTDYSDTGNVGRRILLAPVGGIAFAIMAAIPGALIGLVTGLFGLHKIAAIAGGILFFITYPPSRRRWGAEPDTLTYLFALCGGIGGGLACYFVGNAIH